VQGFFVVLLLTGHISMVLHVLVQIRVKIGRLISIEGLFGKLDNGLQGKLLHLCVEMIK